MVKAWINDIPVEVEPNTTILDAAKLVQVKIPTLCKHPDLKASAGCGICIVRVQGSNKMPRACCTPLEEGMHVITHDAEIVSVRKTVLELIMSNHPDECATCGRNTQCELQSLLADFGIREVPFDKFIPDLPKDASNGTIVLEPRKCIKCGRCIEVCQQMQNVWALSFLERGFKTRISPAGDITLSDSPCVRCGQCSAHCPTGAIFEFDDSPKAWEALGDPDLHCVVQIAPAVRVTIGEHFGFEPGVNLTPQIYAALRRMGFKAIFDTNFGADLTIIEEASEFVERFAHGKGTLPLITSCCPAWVDFMEKFHGDMIDHFSTAKSPHEMVGALAKTYYAEKNNIDPSKVFVVSIMPCTAKKYEIHRNPDMSSSGFQDVDISLTTRELARMIRQSGVDFNSLEGEECDHLLGDYTGAGTIFGATGGVMEAALRTAAHYVTGEKLAKLEFENVRGIQGVKETKINVAGHEVRIAVAHGLANVEYVIDKVRKAKENGEELPYHFIEVMACPGGCVGGGGQPYGVTDELRIKRAKGLYSEDEGLTLRCSHENPSVIKLYDEYLGKPLGEKSHHLLHTKYKRLPVYQR
ncbi:MAG: NADH-dependent [FeFe] hydrogenase, group A6 [Capsulimonadaceae bacterium]|nr:NADH-dependent [FeFe] hydrogenase, group A6 [Capsulimonadaceae bacterium]